MAPELLLGRAERAGLAGRANTKATTVAENLSATAGDAGPLTSAQRRRNESVLHGIVDAAHRLRGGAIGDHAVGRVFLPSSGLVAARARPIRARERSPTSLTTTDVGTTPVRVMLVRSRFTPRLTTEFGVIEARAAGNFLLVRSECVYVHADVSVLGSISGTEQRVAVGDRC